MSLSGLGGKQTSFNQHPVKSIFGAGTKVKAKIEESLPSSGRPYSSNVRSTSTHLCKPSADRAYASKWSDVS